MSENYAFDLNQMTPDARAALHTVDGAWLDGFDTGRAVGDLFAYQRGHRDGYDVGDATARSDVAAQIAADQWAWTQAANREIVAAVTSRPSYAELAEIRGQPDRAAAQRTLLSERGIA